MYCPRCKELRDWDEVNMREECIVCGTEVKAGPVPTSSGLTQTEGKWVLSESCKGSSIVSDRPLPRDKAKEAADADK